MKPFFATTNPLVLVSVMLFAAWPTSFAAAAIRNTQADEVPQQTLTDVIESQEPMVVKLFGAGVGNLDSYGSGILISEQGHVLTVWNHLINTGYLTAVTNEGRRYEVKVAGTSAAHDIAVLKLQSRDDEVFQFISPETFSDADAGDSVLAFSNMFHVAAGNEPVSVVHGVISVRTPLEATQGRWVFPVRTEVLLIDAITNNSGAAGGLLTTEDGTPVGLIGREIRHKISNTWVNYAVPLSTLKPVVLNLLAGKKVESAPAETDEQAMISDQLLTSRFGITMLPNVVERTPAYVDAIVPGSTASSSGLRRGDLIVLVDDTIITCITDFQKQMAARRSGSRIVLTVNRNQQLETVTIKVP